MTKVLKVFVFVTNLWPGSAVLVTVTKLILCLSVVVTFLKSLYYATLAMISLCTNDPIQRDRLKEAHFFSSPEPKAHKVSL